MRSKFFPPWIQADMCPFQPIEYSGSDAVWPQDESLSASFLWEPLHVLEEPKAPWRTCGQGTATFRATAVPVTTSPSQWKSLLLDTDDDFPLVKDHHRPRLHPFQQQYLNTIQTIYSKVAKKQSKFQVEVFASIQTVLDIPLEKQTATFKRKKKS